MRAVGAHVGETRSALVGGGGGALDVALQSTLDVAFDIQFRQTNLGEEKLDLVQVSAALVVRPWRR